MAQPLSPSMQPTDTYGGDEVSALVLDPGFSTTRAGFAGEDVPKCIIPSTYIHSTLEGKERDIFGDNALIPREDFEVRNYMNRDSEVEDWDVAAKMWEYMLVDRLNPCRSKIPPSKNGLNDDDDNNNKETAAKRTAEADGDGDVAMNGNGEETNGAAADDSQDTAAIHDALDALDDAEKPLSENPLLLTEPAWNSAKNRERAIEIIMENWGCPAFWLARTPVLAAFAAGKPSALVVDVGGANVSVTAIHDGLALKKSVVRSPAAGVWLSSQIRSMWEQNEPRVEIVPSFMVENKTPVEALAPANARLKKFPFQIQASYRAYEEERLLTEYKESVVEVFRAPGRLANPGNEEYARTQPGRVFEMPDGYNQMWREQRFKVVEGLWDENAAYPTTNDALRLTKAQTIPELIRQSLNGTDADVRPNLLANIVVTGSTSLITGFTDRLHNEVQAMFPNVRVRLNAAGLTSERRFGAWIGGSILASVGTFHQMWISRKEYEENGAGIVEKRCK